MAVTRAPYIIQASIVLLTLLVSGMILRTIFRVKQRTIGWDDVFLYISFLCTLVLCITVMKMTNVGFGMHINEVSTDDLSWFVKEVFVTNLSYIWAFVTAKLSFATLYLRLINGKKYQLLNKGLIVILLLQGIAETGVVLFSCKPIYKSWTFGAEGECLNLVPFFYTTFVFKFLTDLILFIEPIPTMWRLQLPLGKRLGLVIMMSIGLLVCVISIIRVTYITATVTDPTFLLVDSMVWSEVEVCALIICACVPSLRYIIQMIPGLNRLVGFSSNRGPTYGSSRSKGISIQLNSRSNKSKTGNRTQNGKFPPYGITSAVIGQPRPGASDSTDEIIALGEKAGIMVTRDIEMGVESHRSSPPVTTHDRASYSENDAGRVTPQFPPPATTAPDSDL